MTIALTEEMRLINALAQEEAARLGTNCIGPEHYLLALLGAPDCVGAHVIEHLGISLQGVREQVLQQVIAGPGVQGQEMQLSPSGKRVIDLAKEEARQLWNIRLETDHLLLGLIREGEGLPARVLVKLGADLDRVRRQVYLMRVSKKKSR
jgi:ATP-dependent Clp protease ATP-binding subunit ClpC